jgi:hypothetical protein
MLDIDTSGGGGSQGPFIQWQSKESVDGSIPGRSWCIRDANGKVPFKGFDAGVVLDIENLKIGWCWSTGQKGVAPDWRWAPSANKNLPEPAPLVGEARWQKGFSIPLAYPVSSTEGAFAVWEQAQAGAWSAFGDLIKLLKASDPQPGKLPLVKQAGFEKIEGKKGITFAPKFAVVRWVPRPPALKADIAVDIGDEIPSFA